MAKLWMENIPVSHLGKCSGSSSTHTSPRLDGRHLYSDILSDFSINSLQISESSAGLHVRRTCIFIRLLNSFLGKTICKCKNAKSQVSPSFTKDNRTTPCSTMDVPTWEVHCHWWRKCRTSLNGDCVPKHIFNPYADILCFALDFYTNRFCLLIVQYNSLCYKMLSCYSLYSVPFPITINILLVHTWLFIVTAPLGNLVPSSKNILGFECTIKRKAK